MTGGQGVGSDEERKNGGGINYCGIIREKSPVLRFLIGTKMRKG